MSASADSLFAINSAEALIAPLQALMTQTYGEAVAVHSLRRITAGAAAQTWAFETSSARGNTELILRRGQDANQFGGALSKTEEAAVIRAAVAAGVPAPAVVVELAKADGLGEGFIMQRIHGETLPTKILRDPCYADARARMAAQCGEILAAIHAVPVESVAGLRRASATEQIKFYHHAYKSYQQVLPVFDYAFRWLAEHCPQAVGERLVHGDFRNGNLMIGEEGVRAVLDWELAHIGDPMEDLAWLCVNSWRFGNIDKPVGGFGERKDLYAAYANASGRQVDESAVKFWEVFGVLKWGVICLYQCEIHLSGRERSLERAAIGRRVSECELDILDLLQSEGASCR